MGKSTTDAMLYKRQCVYCRGWIDTRQPDGWDYTQDRAPVHDSCARQWVQEINAKLHPQHLAMAEAHEAQRDATMERLQALEIELDALQAEVDEDKGEDMSERHEEGSPMATFPVYLPYVMHLERYVEIEAESLEEAQALVYQMVRKGQVQRPSYTEGRADWTEVTDMPHAKNGFIIEGEVI